MKVERTKNASRNLLFGIIQKAYQLLIPFFIRTAMIYQMGINYAGLDSLFLSVFQVLSLAELGVGSAMVYTMYQPIVNGDTRTINALLRLYRIYYRIIGVVICVLGLLLLPLIPKLIHGTVPGSLNIYALYLLNLSGVVLSYWLFAYKNSLLVAHQRTDLISKVMLPIMSLQYGAQLLIIIFVKNYYLYMMAALLAQAVINITTAVVATKFYPDYKPQGKLGKAEITAINNRVKDLFTSKFGSVCAGAIDSVTISAVLGLTALAIYQNYNFISTAVSVLIAVIFASCMAGVGHSIITETSEKNYADFKKFTFIIAWLSGFCAGCLLCLYQPFMELWVGSEFVMPYPIVICFSANFFVFEMYQMLNLYKDASGMWHKDRFRPLTVAIVKLAICLVLIQFFGLYGVILANLFSILLVGFPWLVHNLFTTVFQRAFFAHIRRLAFYLAVTACACALTVWICGFINLSGIPALLTKGLVCCVVLNLFFFIFYRKCAEWVQTLQLLDKVLGKKTGLFRLLLKATSIKSKFL